MAKQSDQFSFNISLSVLNHLGRNLYRNFMTVLGEAISNAWDADAKNVWIYIDKVNKSLVVKDDGDGMDASDFQSKFLKIGYSKRKDGDKSQNRKRPFIGRKGIGKLALLSCAQKISVLTRKSPEEKYVGGVIDNSGLNEAIKSDLTPDQYLLGQVDESVFEKYKKGHKKGTIIYFENINEGIRNSAEHLKKLIALYFRFSLIDKNFNIFFDEEPITLEYLDELAKKTEFVWVVNDIDDPYIKEKLTEVKEIASVESEINIRGFVASVETPKALKIPGTQEKVGIDLFVNGRLRERDVLRHIPRASLVETYLYGQIHFDALDGEGDIDRFTSSREGIVADDPEFQKFLESLKKILARVLSDWDKWRVKHKEDGDSENPRLTRKERKSRELFNAVSDDYSLPKKSENKELVDHWVNALADDAQFNFSSYAECFVSENLIRKLIIEKNISLSPDADNVIKEFKKLELKSKGKGNISIELRKYDSDLSYLSMTQLANMVDGIKDPEAPLKEACLSRDANEYKPMRDALAHTALLTEKAKDRLTSVYENIKGRIKTLLMNS